MMKNKYCLREFFEIIALAAVLMFALVGCGDSDGGGGDGNSTPNYEITGTYSFPISTGQCIWVFNANGTYEVTGFGIITTKSGTWSIKGNDITIASEDSLVPTEIFIINENSGSISLSIKDNSAQVSVLLVSFGLAQKTVTLTKQGFTYTIYYGESTITITGYNGAISSHLEIPAQINGKPVTAIRDQAFENKNIISVTIPNSVKTIGKWAFSYNQLSSINIGNSVTTIGNSAFERNQLTNITIPNSVTTIGNSAFSSNQLTSVTIPNSVITIGEGAFTSNHLTSIIIPDSVTTIGRLAFHGNPQLLSINVSSNNPKYSSVDGVFYNKNYSILIKWPEGKTADTVTIPNSVTIISESAFAYSQLSSVTIPNSVTSIGDYAFTYNQLTSIIIPENITRISSYTFSNNKLTSVTIPNRVTTIGDHAFSSNQLTSVIIPNSVTTIGDAAFSSNQQLTSVTIGSNVILNDDPVFNNSFGPIGFTEAYNNQNKQAGTYTRPSTNYLLWEKQ